MQSTMEGPFVQRVIGAAKLDGAVYEEVERDQNATTQAIVVVAIAALSAGIGALRDDGGSGLIGGVIGGLLGFAVSAYFIYFVGTRLIPAAGTSATIGEVVRCLGFASAPGILAFLNIIPGIGGLLGFLIGVWGTVALIVGLMHALEMSMWRAIATAILASVVAAIVGVIIALIFGISAVGLGALF